MTALQLLAAFALGGWVYAILTAAIELLDGDIDDRR